MSNPDNPKSSKPADDEEEQIQAILQLMKSRAAGRATDEQVEAAVQRMLGQPATVPDAAATLRKRKDRLVDVDTDDYDNQEEEAEESHEKEQSVVEAEDEALQSDAALKRSSTLGKKTSLTSKSTKKQRKKKSATSSTKETSLQPLDPSLYEDIPMGMQAARMLRTFGDGHSPLPETVQLTLQGARRMVQVAIQDARHVRRQRRKAYASAQSALKAGVRHKSQPTNGRRLEDWPPDMQYRVYSGYDPLAYDAKCSFDVEELEQLYPEEMNAYSRWNDNYQAYSEKTEEPHTKDAPDVSEDVEEEEEETNDNDYNVDEGNDTQQQPVVGGHLQERAAQFDIRTDIMKDDRYMEFSELRTGSFLPRKSKSSDLEDQEQLIWAKVPVTAVRFLHWVGFDPQSAAFPPPSPGTTHALAFLAYDFFGRIVEKAIELRVQRQQKRNREEIIVLELQPGEQLAAKDIEHAMQDPDIRPVPLYGSSDKDKAGPQLYFGPGFEHRLEMELEELIAARSSGSDNSKSERQEKQEDLRIRKQEEELFARLAEQPTTGGLSERGDGDDDDVDENLSV